MNGQCDFAHGGRVCGHVAARHETDEDGRDWCVPCWGTDDDDLAYHTFSDATVTA